MPRWYEGQPLTVTGCCASFLVDKRYSSDRLPSNLMPLSIPIIRLRSSSVILLPCPVVSSPVLLIVLIRIRKLDVFPLAVIPTIFLGFCLQSSRKYLPGRFLHLLLSSLVMVSSSMLLSLLDFSCSWYSTRLVSFPFRGCSSRRDIHRNRFWVFQLSIRRNFQKYTYFLCSGKKSLEL